MYFHIFGGGRNLILNSKYYKSCVNEILVEAVEIAEGPVAFAVLRIRFSIAKHLTMYSK